MNKDNGGPAFPRDGRENPCIVQPQEGMTLRDYFAAAIMQSQFSFKEAIEEVPQAAQKKGMTNIEYVAYACYQMADAMLKEREK